MQRRLRTAVIGLAALLATIAVPVYAVKTWRKDGYSDFDVYHRTALRLQAGDWAHVYDWRTDGTTPFRYSPLTLPFFRPLAALPHHEGRELWLFLQLAAFALGFWQLSRVARALGADGPLVSAASFLFVLRYCLDSLSIGQVDSVNFLCLTLALRAFVGTGAGSKPERAGAALLAPAALKIGEGLLYPLVLLKSGPRALAYAAPATLLLALGVSAWPGSWQGAVGLWSSYLDVTRSDSAFIDAAHYGSQSLKSFLLRLAATGAIERQTALHLTLALAGAGIAALLAFWWRRRAETPRARALLFSLGVFAVLCFRPETFKYTFPILAIPIATLLSGPLDRVTRAALVFVALTMSLGGLDIVGEKVFFFLMHASVPFFATSLLALATARLALRETVPAQSRRRKSAVVSRKSKVAVPAP